MNHAENKDPPINTSSTQFGTAASSSGSSSSSSASGPAQVVAAPVNSQVPVLQNQNVETVATIVRPKIANIMIPKVGDSVYVMNEPGQAVFLYKGTVTEYPIRINNINLWSHLSMLITEVIRPGPNLSGNLPFEHRNKVGTIQQYSRRFVRYLPPNLTGPGPFYATMPMAQFEAYVQGLMNETGDPAENDPQGGALPNKRNVKKKSKKSRKLSLRKRKQKSHKRRNA